LLITKKKGKDFLQKIRKCVVEKDGKYYSQEEIEDFENNVNVVKLWNE